MAQPFHIGMLLYPDLTQLDLTGPAQFLSRAPGVKMHYVWKTIEPVPSDAGIALMPTDTFESCPQLDMLCVPGGAGQTVLMQDQPTLDFLKRQGEGAKYVTSVCSGSLLLGAAGLLKGYKSACHWMWRDYLPAFGAIPVNARVVKDRNRMSGGGVTAGIDFALTVIAEIWGEEQAKMIQLYLEYNPQPPFNCGSPEAAGPELTAKAKEQLKAAVARRESVINEVSARQKASAA
ncbi:MAG: DJ-1/PfpI family protein [Alphaproteobacteria bacterium]|nr:DJ-1/PfpI family protein [Alphaproteobacteria bacterium]